MSNRGLEDVTTCKGKILSPCGHAFHEFFIRRILLSNQEHCPECNTKIEFGKRSFTWIKDPDLTKNQDKYESYICINGETKHTVVFEKDMSEDSKQAMLRLYEESIE